MKVFLSLLNETTVNKQKKVAVRTPLWLEKLLSQNNSFSHEFYSQNEFTINWVLQQDYNLFTTLYSLALQHQHRRERPAQLLPPHVLTSRWQPSPNVSLNQTTWRWQSALKCYLLCYISQKHFRWNENLHRKSVVNVTIVYKLTTLSPKKVEVGHSEF